MDSQTIILISAAFLTATLSGFLGMGGGILPLTIMATYFPPAILIPLHGSVQLVSNGVRMVINWRHITWSILLFKILITLLAGRMVLRSLLG